ncbi:MAG: pyruvate synthase subunit beta [Deltaproteobacteria bacterium]|nr:pyruvate synthase subunit beta [Deltaproteobacteria bacterium]
MMNEPALHGMAQTKKDRSAPVLRPGNTNCGGCGMSNLLQMLSRAAENNDIKIVIPACCAAITTGMFPESSISVPTILTTFAAGASVATGVASVAQLNNEETRVICLAGDGGTYDIGMGTLSAAAERNEDILYICYDNEIYGNTGGQRSSATPTGASTTTTLGGKSEVKKDIMGIMAAHHIPYAASISLAHADDTLRKLRFALNVKGFRFLHVLSPCPTGWKSEPAVSIELVRLAVRSGLFPVFEVFDGDHYTINIEPDFSSEALLMYLSLQRRFRKSGVTEEAIRPNIERYWHQLRAMSGRIMPAIRDIKTG